MPARGLQDVPLNRIPAKWDPAWFAKFCREVLSLADVRNAVSGTGVTITGGPSEPATISASTDVANLLTQSYVLATPSGFLSNERILDGESGVVTITDGGPNSTIEVGLQELGVPYSKLIEGPAFSVLGNQLTVDGPIAPITGASEGDVLWIRDIDGAGTLGLEFSYLRFLDGSASAPGIAFYDDQDNGLYRLGTDNFGMATGGVARWDIDTARVQQTMPLIINVAATASQTVDALQINNVFSGGGIVARTISSPDAGVNTSNQLGIWENAGRPTTNAGFGFRWFHDGAPSLSGDLIFYSHNNSASGTEIYRHARDAAFMLFVAGSAAAPTIAIRSTNLGIYSSAADTLNVATSGTNRLQISTTAVTSSLQHLGVSGSAGAPSYAFFGDPNTGLYSFGADDLGFATGGALRLDISTTAITSTLPWQGPSGSAGSPSLSFSGDPNTGAYSVGADQWGVSAGGTLRLTISTTEYLATLPWHGQDGTNSAPAFSFSADPNTGMYRGGTDLLYFATGGALRFGLGAAGEILDSAGSPGAAGEVLTSAGAGAPWEWDAGGGSGAPASLTYITEADETADLPNSLQLIAGVGITFDTSTPNELEISASGATGPDVQVFTAGTTNWTKPAGATASTPVEIILFGAGGGGGGGAGGSAGNVRRGGGSGGGGAYVRRLVSAGLLGGTESVAVGAAGTSGSAGSSGNGGNGGAGGSTTFGAHLTAYGGGGGAGGAVAGASGGSGAGTGGAGTVGNTLGALSGGLPSQTASAAGISGGGAGVVSTGGAGGGLPAEFGGGGGANATQNAGQVGGTSLWAGGAGGSGGGVNASNTAGTGAAGGATGTYSTTGGGGGAGGGTGAAGTAGTAGDSLKGGTGGGGGGGNSAGTGGAGGNGGAAGGGGGGGGGGTTNGGAGGTGGAGYAVVITYL